VLYITVYIDWGTATDTIWPNSRIIGTENLLFISCHKYLYPVTNIYILSQIFISRHKYLYPVTNIYILSQIFIYCHKYLYPVTNIYILSQIFNMPRVNLSQHCIGVAKCLQSVELDSRHPYLLPNQTIRETPYSFEYDTQKYVSKLHSCCGFLTLNSDF
jgi:hypothetical protein